MSENLENQRKTEERDPILPRINPNALILPDIYYKTKTTHVFEGGCDKGVNHWGPCWYVELTDRLKMPDLREE